MHSQIRKLASLLHVQASYHLHRFAASLAVRAATYLKEQCARRTAIDAKQLEVQIKANDADLVTQADEHVEEMIRDAIKAQYPEHKLIGEVSLAHCLPSPTRYL